MTIPRATDPIGLQFFFVRRRNREYNVKLLADILTQLIKVQQREIVPRNELNNVLTKIVNVGKNELPKLKNDLARLGLIVPSGMFDEKTYGIKEKAIYSSGKARYWRITREGFEITRGEDVTLKAKLIAKAYLKLDIMSDWVIQLLAYQQEEIDISLAINVLKSIVMTRLRYATEKSEIESLEFLLNKCENKPSDVIKKTLKPLEIMSEGELLRVERNKIKLMKVDEYIVIKRRISTTKYLELVANAYLSYLKEKGLYQTIISQDTAAWPVPLQEVIERIKDISVKSMHFDEHVEYCRRISHIHSGFEYVYQPLARGIDKHVIMIRTSLLKKIFKNIYV